MTTQINSVFGASVDKDGDILIGLNGISTKPMGFKIHRGAVQAIVTTLLGLLAVSREKYGKPEDFQPVALTGCHQYRDPDGFSHLELMFEQNLQIATLFDRSSLDGLKTALSELERTGKIRPTAQRH
ncbi:MAG: hypothetical protein ABI705_09325 [Aestuariivirga sp.]